MAEQIPVEIFRANVVTYLEEIFEKVHGYVLDPGTPLFETLSSMSAEEASKPISANCACLAAQVNHVRFTTQSATRFAGLDRSRPLVHV